MLFSLALFGVFLKVGLSSGSSVYVCQNQVSYIGCPKNSKLRVAYANYGRTDNHICPVQGSKPNTNCISSTSLAKTKWNCNGYSLCKLSPSDAVFGDPCPDTWKYIHVRFDCVNDADVKATPMVAFSARLSKSIDYGSKIRHGGVVVYDDIVTSVGGGYSAHTGIFTAPMSGFYVFAWTTLTVPDKKFDTELKVNGVRKSLNNCSNTGGKAHATCSATVTVFMKKRQHAYITCHAGNFLYESWSHFTGFKLG